MSFIHSPEISVSESAERLNAEDGLLKFGIPFLDESTEGILRDDLILVGARSGAGKTQFCVNLAWENVQSGKRVHYLALEAGYAEIERRIKFRIFCDIFFKRKKENPSFKNKTEHRVTFKNWALGRLSLPYADIEAECNEEFSRKANGLYTLYKQGTFGVKELIQSVLYCAPVTDLVIIDHVHYFDFEDDNENRAIKEIAMTARSLALEERRPIILVAHIRKSDRFSSSKCPGLEDFHGSSDLFKVSTKSITIAPGDNFSPVTGKAETYMRVVKDRFDSSLERHMGCLVFDTRKGTYEKEYQLGPHKQERDSAFIAYADENLPDWCRSVKRPKATEGGGVLASFGDQKFPQRGSTQRGSRGYRYDD